MKYKITGTIERVGGIEHITDKFCKCQVVIEASSNPEYPNPVLIEFCNKTSDLPSAFQVGEKVEIGFFINGNKGTGKYEDRVFVNLRGADIAAIRDSAPAQKPEPEQKPEQSTGDDDNLPF